jgi:CYTH domain-containing protein
MCFCHLAKRRYLPEGTDWTIDSFGYPLEGETVEIELKNKNQEFQFPSWIYEAVEITDSISSRDLAKLATKLRKNKSPCALVSLL